MMFYSVRPENWKKKSKKTRNKKMRLVCTQSKEKEPFQNAAINYLTAKLYTDWIIKYF
jgi:hypothetical protein